MRRAWEHFDHGADVGVRGFGKTLEEAFGNAAHAMTAAITDPNGVRPELAVTIHCDAPNLEVLLLDWLNALVFEMADRALLFGRFDLAIEGTSLAGTAWGEPIDPDRHRPGVEVKGATFTELAVRRDNEDWIAQCVIDV